MRLYYFMKKNIALRLLSLFFQLAPLGIYAQSQNDKALILEKNHET
jgi:hypothetical protein